MFTQKDFQNWRDLESFALELKSEISNSETLRHCSSVLFRGQGSHQWALETTLERAAPHLTHLAEYYRSIAITQTHIESLTQRRWNGVDYPAVVSELSKYDALSLKSLPHPEYLAHLRHNGFPSPLLDWSRSIYVAAFFAFRHTRADDDRAAIFVYQEYAGEGKSSCSSQPQIHTLGPNIRTHERHFLQQGEYTSALRYENEAWQLATHMDVFSTNQNNQDNLWKLTVPSSCRAEVLLQLEAYNINAYSLFQSEEALFETLAERHLLRNGVAK
jgi:FRG domain